MKYCKEKIDPVIDKLKTFLQNKNKPSGYIITVRIQINKNSILSCSE